MKIALIELKIENTDKYVFQRRDGKAPTSPNLLAFFGGGMKRGEQPKEAAIRELAEETSLNVASIALAHIVSLGQPSEIDSNAEPLELHLFSVTLTNANFTVKEGEGREIYTRVEALNRNDLAPTARYLLEQAY